MSAWCEAVFCARAHVSPTRFARYVLGRTIYCIHADRAIAQRTTFRVREWRVVVIPLRIRELRKESIPSMGRGSGIALDNVHAVGGRTQARMRSAVQALPLARRRIMRVRIPKLPMNNISDDLEKGEGQFATLRTAWLHVHHVLGTSKEI